MTDETVLSNIEALVKREHALYDKGHLNDDEQTELRGLEVKLDQLWDLLRQRRAREEYGQNPDDARERAASTVEGYTNAPYKPTK